MLTGKQRSYLKSIANGIDPIFQIGKNGINDNFIKQVDDALEAREIIKVNVLNNSFLNAKDAANEVAELTNSEFVQSIGNKFVLYRESKDKKKIELP
ncbi:ribosome assembly RNA-binding protein YhbY [Anaerosalibacter sp. Marseille-P3206]|uniref:ribosome assembly RNA-binding protein YhbY n=1 Tax=Anaerosalibacter sp. Marseille-P3206 TaxID=1871005 RepID=UPI0009866586|nr:ribosome assembly RNA-binding protein YhbY [Anaerosalibacter sp. Marseille-P3206]